MHYVLGDVHGYFSEFCRLKNKILEQDPDAQFIITGDWIDRGPEVMQTVKWAMENITPDGRYQSVLGNHEQMVIDWFYGPFAKYDTAPALIKKHLHMPKTHYDFSARLKEAGLTTHDDIAPIIEFFESLPLTISLSVTSPWGVEREYRVAHGWYPAWMEKMTDEELTPKQIEKIVWERDQALLGHGRDDYVVVHGHTPTLNLAYYLQKDPTPINPGLIAYRQNTINVDGGRPYRDQVKYFCTLCGICLETMEEFFSDDLPANYPYQENIYRKMMKNRLIGN